MLCLHRNVGKDLLKSKVVGVKAAGVSEARPNNFWF